MKTWKRERKTNIIVIMVETSNKVFKYWLFPVLWALVIFTFSSFQTAETTKIYWGDFIIKKTAHIVEYGVFAVLLYRAMINSGMNKTSAMKSSVLISFLYGVTDEFHQSFTPGRGPTARDVIIDTIGAWFFVYGFIGNIKKFPERVQTWARRVEVT